MVQHARQASISEVQRVSEDIVGIQSTLAAVKSASKRDARDIKEAFAEFQQREKRRQLDKDTVDNEVRSDVLRKLQSLESKVSEFDFAATFSTVKDSVSKLSSWCEDLQSGLASNQKVAANDVRNLRAVCIIEKCTIYHLTYIYRIVYIIA